ncbi:uncharacterized protein LOC125762630 [Anopheles funestus]|uniref:uncharacterized protein LOC125762630 n=1 Tax=Anopheles funestus TaxID=62324 RepID=UPI0020C5EBEE|nr:uncharacterized protein LOC125762630 [Anopheles funestus]
MELNQPPAKWQCTCNCGVIENDASSSKSNASHADGIFHSKPSSQTNVSELIFDVERDEPLNVSDDLQTTCEVVPSEAAQGNSISKSASVQSALSASKDFKNNKPAPTDVIVSVEHDNGGVGGQHVDEESALPVLSHNTELKEKMEDAMVEERVFPKFDELMATVDGLVEREKMFFERLNTIEKLMSTYIDELYSRLQDEKCVPPAGGFDDMNLVQNLQQESSKPNVAHQRIIDTENLLETNIRFIIEELQNEIWSLKKAFNRLNIAAGGMTDVETKTHVQCISCNCAVAMNIHEERIPTPVPFHVSRCTKPMLRRQLDWLKKEMKYSGVAPVSMQPYYQLLKKNKLLSPK